MSLLACAAVPPVMMVAMAPDAAEKVVDLHAIDPDKMKALSQDERAEYVKSLPWHRVQGVERLTYWFSHPQWLMGWWRSALFWFLFFFAATTLVSFLNAKDQR